MDRLEQLRKHLAPRLESGALGLEIAPWHSPVLPKAVYPSIRTLDVFSQSELIERAKAAQPSLPDSRFLAIEPVDFVGNAARLGAVIPRNWHGQFSFILSSHNFEHIPNPVGFLVDCYDILADDGILVMAIPDKRACFDHWRPVSTLGQIVDAHIEYRNAPSFGQQMDHSLGRAFVKSGSSVSTVFSTETVNEDIWSDESRFPDFANRLELRKDDAGDPEETTYVSAHCWTFIPESFALMLRDLNALKLTQLFPMEISPTVGAEFFVHLSKTPVNYPDRTRMCRTLQTALGESKVRPENDPARYRRLFVGYMKGLRLLDKLLGRR